MTFKKYPAAIFAALLAALVLAVYWRTSGFGFISLDDPMNVSKNPLVTGGLTLDSVKAAFSSTTISLAWISYMADVEISGMDPGGFHRTNVLLYLFSAVLLFLFFRSATGSVWKSFFAVALWAMHPMRVESVAWISERKDVLSGLFFILSLWSYLLYTRTRKPGWYGALLLCGILGVLAKPILVVLPVALLLFDFWPLGRFPQGGENRAEKLRGLKSLLLEKAPLFALSFIFVANTLYAHADSDAKAGYERNFFYGFSNAAASYWKYLVRTFFPGDLMLSYDTPASAPGLIAVIISLAALVVASVAAYRLRRKVPEITFGWFWFLLILFPNSGIVPTGMQSFADRYTFLPHLGVAIALVWGTARLAGRTGFGEKGLIPPGVAAVTVLAILSGTFTGYWKNSLTYFGRIDEIYGGKNAVALGHLADASMDENNPAKFLAYVDRLEKLDSFYYPNYKRNKAIALYKLGRYDEALEFLRQELKANPQSREISDLIQNITVVKTGKQNR
ncbi:tetratricopeptide repeat protein [bacterium]|nr:MAG: tetratricopeptide repeat protein [bacterium]